MSEHTTSSLWYTGILVNLVFCGMQYSNQTDTLINLACVCEKNNLWNGSVNICTENK